MRQRGVKRRRGLTERLETLGWSFFLFFAEAGSHCVWHREQVWGYTFGDTAEKSLIMVGVGNFLLLLGGLEPDEEERDRLKDASLLASDGSLGLGPSRL